MGGDTISSSVSHLPGYCRRLFPRVLGGVVHQLGIPPEALSDAYVNVVGLDCSLLPQLSQQDIHTTNSYSQIIAAKEEGKKPAPVRNAPLEETLMWKTWDSLTLKNGVLY